MDNNKIIYIKVDDNKLINQNKIRWIKKLDDCLEICLKSNGCSLDNRGTNTHKLCKINNLDS